MGVVFELFKSHLMGSSANCCSKLTGAYACHPVVMNNENGNRILKIHKRKKKSVLTIYLPVTDDIIYL